MEQSDGKKGKIRCGKTKDTKRKREPIFGRQGSIPKWWAKLDKTFEE